MSQQSDEYIREVLDRNINRIREYFTEHELKDKEKFKQTYLNRFSGDRRGETFIKNFPAEAVWNYMDVHGTQGGFYDRYGHRIVREINPDDGTYKFRYAEGTVLKGENVGGQEVREIEKKLPQSFLKEQKLTRHKLKTKQVVMRYAKGTRIKIDGKFVGVGGRFAKLSLALPKAIMQKYRLDKYNQPILSIRRTIKGKEQELHRYRKGAMRKGRRVGGQFVPRKDRRGGEWWMEDI